MDEKIKTTEKIVWYTYTGVGTLVMEQWQYTFVKNLALPFICKLHVICIILKKILNNIWVKTVFWSLVKWYLLLKQRISFILWFIFSFIACLHWCLSEMCFEELQYMKSAIIFKILARMVLLAYGLTFPQT